ncbi:MAG: hypothetical protein ABI867_17210 [Kofleriaceae bacterium]
MSSLRVVVLAVVAACRLDDTPAPPGNAVELTIVVDGDGCGGVIVEAAGIACPGICRATLRTGTRVTIDAVACDTANTLQGVSNLPCDRTPCTFTVDQSTTLFARFQAPRNLAFVSRGVVAGSATTIAAADALCAQEATAAGLAGTYIAWLSTTTAPIAPRLANAHGWIRPDGLPVANDLLATAATPFHYPIALYADGMAVPFATEVLTGTTTAGIAATNCNDFTAQTSSITGRPGAVDGAFTEQPPLQPNCGEHPVYCVGIDHDVGIDPLAFLGKLAFVSAPHALGGGRAAADARCADEAAAAGREGTFQALLETTDQRATAGFSSVLGWVDARGHRLFASVASAPASAIAYGANGEPRGAGVWTGAAGPTPDQADATCADWTSTSATAIGAIGSSNDALRYWRADALGCENSFALYCLER